MKATKAEMLFAVAHRERKDSALTKTHIGLRRQGGRGAGMRKYILEFNSTY